MSSLDIFNPQVSVVAKGTEGKVILVYGGNALGKTKQSTRFPKPFYLAFEKGLNAIAGVPFAPINSWSDFIKVNKQITGKATIGKAKEMYKTIILDEVETAARYCTKYVCDKYEADSIASGNKGYGLWSEYSTAFWEEIDKMVSSGFTVIFIAHQVVDDTGRAYPKGDKRAIAPVVDNSDIIVHLRSNGVDEKGSVIKSSAYMAETPEFFARSRFDYLVTSLPEFTAEALEAAISKAVEDQEKAEGIKAVSYKEQQKTLESEDLDYDKLRAEIIKLGKKLHSEDKGTIVNEIIEGKLGKGKKVTDFAKGQVEVMAVVLDALKDEVNKSEEIKE
ncbi:ATP-binding protein [Paenibacillus donghaensis]|uniref:ATP-binding protein n=1 Tax=Paenibacillus donghaensis TaxID=414771 RepID=A0A2Z2KFD6_9BACL|nr:ATP-binding protein [Paenibacillus donghaensis]ASA22685.1 hypothetical protein B9T62_18940 [Paenibacillus donghaensis]